MIKKIISGLLSAVIGTVFITADYDSVRQSNNRSIDNAQNTFSKNGMSINSSNSLGNYISDAMQNKEQPKNMAYQCVSDYDYELGFAELDIETGIITIFSSQPNDAKISIIVKYDDENSEVAYKTEVNVLKGKDTVNTTNLDVNVLPEFFYVDLQIFDMNNKAVGSTYTINKYTSFKQEILATDVNDFEEQYVVNLDEDEDTNFIVLNENTIKAETTASSNILVSADYDNDKYIFESIDDTIRYLQKGDNFFIQPTEEDLIAISIENIEIEDNRAILTGGDSIEGLFDFIKIEAQADDVSNAVVDESEIPDYMEYNGKVDGEDSDCALEYTIDTEYSYLAANINSKSSLEMEWEIGHDLVEDDSKSTDRNNPDFKKAAPEGNKAKKNVKISAELKATLKIEASFEFEFYQKGFHVDFELKFDPKATLTFEFGGKIEITVPTPPVGWAILPGLWVGFEPELKFTFEGKITFKKSIGYEYVISFDTSRKKKLSYTCTPKNDDKFEFEIEASISVSFDIQPTIFLISKKTIKADLSCPLTLKLTCSNNYETFDGELNRPDYSKHDTILWPNYTKDTLHTCDECYKIQPSFSAKITLEIDVKCIPFMETMDFNLLESPEYEFLKMYYSASHNVADLGDCPYVAYKVNFNLSGDEKIPAAGALISVDRISGTADGSGHIHFYCANGSHSYSISVNGKNVESGSFVIDNSTQDFNLDLVKNEKVVSTGEKAVTTTSPPQPEMESHIEDIPERSAEKACIESGRLGDEIFYFIYANGEMNIQGTGNMYTDLTSVLKNKKAIKEVTFIDNAPSEGDYITNIGNHLFDGAENLEVVYLSNEIKSIGDYAFCGCKKLRAFRYGGENDTSESLVFPAKLESIGKWAFIFCDDVPFGDIVFGNELQTIGMQAFQGDNGITSVYIPESVTYINSSAFEKCSNIKKVDIRAKAEKIRGFLYGSSSLEELVVPRFMTVNDSKNLADIFNDNEDGAYNSTEVPMSLKKVTVLSGDVIPDGALNGFGVVETIAVPAGIKSIGKNAFPGFTTTNIICSDETQDLSFSELFKDVEFIGEKAFIGNKVPIGDLVFGDNLSSIGHQAFQGATGITSVYIPESVTSMGVCVFEECSNIKIAVIKANVEDYRGIFYRTNSMEELTLPSFITIRGSHSLSQLFNDNEDGAYNSTEVPATLNKVTILSGETIPDGTFSGLGNVKTFALPEGIKKIGEKAFEWCKVEQIICSDATKDLSFSEVFNDVESIGNYAFRSCSNLQLGDIVFGNNLKNVGVGCFSSTSKLTSIELNGVETIGFGAFEGCAALKKVVIRGNVKSITGGLFYNSSSLEDLVLPNFIETKDRFNLYGNDQLRILFCDNEDVPWNDIKIPEGFKKLTILNGESMPKNYLNSLYNVTSLGLPEELNFVDVHASQDLQKLEEIVYNGTDEQWKNIDIREQNDPLRKVKIVLPAKEEHIYGDANGDGEIDMSDVVLIMQALANPNKFGVNGTAEKHITADGFKYADADGDGLTVNDALRIQQYLLGLIPSLT